MIEELKKVLEKRLPEYRIEIAELSQLHFIPKRGYKIHAILSIAGSRVVLWFAKDCRFGSVQKILNTFKPISWKYNGIVFEIPTTKLKDINGGGWD